VTTLTWSHTVGAGPSSILIVGVSLRDTKAPSTSVTYGGIPLALVGSHDSQGNKVRIEMWQLIAPPPGAAAVVVTLPQSKNIVGGSRSFFGVDQTAPHGGFTGTHGKSTGPAILVPSAAGELVVDVMGGKGDAGSITVGPGQAQHWNLATGTGWGDGRGAGSSEPGAASVTMSWTQQFSQEWSIGAISLRPGVPLLTLVKSVSPAGPQPPGIDLDYSVTFANTGGDLAHDVVVIDPIPADTDFKIGSAATSLGTTGLSVGVSYSDDGGLSWGWTPTSGAGGAPSGYDRTVTHVRWTFVGTLSPLPPDNTGVVAFSVRIQ
jgi:uncharacterized repeat protein (TIGR01451 family)